MLSRIFVIRNSTKTSLNTTRRPNLSRLITRYHVPPVCHVILRIELSKIEKVLKIPRALPM